MVPLKVEIKSGFVPGAGSVPLYTYIGEKENSSEYDSLRNRQEPVQRGMRIMFLIPESFKEIDY
jgi:hypothetical protein